MLNLTHTVRSRQNFEVHLTRKRTLNDGQNGRSRVEYVRANDRKEAGNLALAMPHNAAFRIASVKEIR